MTILEYRSRQSNTKCGIGRVGNTKRESHFYSPPPPAGRTKSFPASIPAVHKILPKRDHEILIKV